MGTVVCFHAHPDDEAIATSGMMAKAKALGHRTVLVFATRGEHGEPVEGVLDEGEQLTLRRTAECYEAARVIGAERVEFLGYVDSGMAGTPTAEAPWSFAQANVERAAGRLALILGEEAADVLTIYDDNGGYGHPDHIQVHRVGTRAAELIGLDQVFQSTMNRTAIAESFKRFAEEADELPDGVNPEEFDTSGFGKPAEEITHQVDVTPHLGVKRGAMLAHSSQIAADHFFLTMSDKTFAEAMGTEWYIASGPAPAEGSVAAELFTPFG